MHTHSTVSDGSDPPSEVVRLAREAGCSAVALTDHDRLDGVPEAVATGQSMGVEVVPGCEISCEVAVGTMHLLVYFVPVDEGPLQDTLVSLQDARERRNVVMASRLGLSYEALVAEAGGMGVGRPHAAALLVREGRASSIQDAFDRFLGKGKPGYVEKERLSPADAVRLSLASGALPVLAHPLTLEASDLGAAVRELAELGLVGLECWYGRYSPEDRAGLASMAASMGLVATGGSDHHGTYKPDLSVGVGRGDLRVPDSALEDLRSRLP